MLDVKNNLKVLVLFLIISIALVTNVNAQHRGDALSFQGLNENNAIGVKAAAMGGADVAHTGDLSSIFSNPAGLSQIDRIKISVSTNSFQKKWWENQDYRPNRQFTNLSFILDGLYTPNKENNGKWDYDAFFDDSTYIVRDPKLGLDPYSEDAAIWSKKESDFVLNNIAFAVPLKISEYSFVVSAAYSQKNNILDYDRNTTYLDPHIGSNGYGPIEERVTSAEDTVHVNWSDYTRAKNGDIKQMTFNISSEVIENLNLGIGVNILSGQSDDFYALNKVGYFDLIGGANSFKFSYDTLNTSVSGTSEYSGMNFTLGLIYQIGQFNLGFKLNTPYTLERKWNYKYSTATTDTSFFNNLNGTDKVDLPVSFAFGLSVKPLENFRVAFDLEKANYSKAEFNISTSDSLSSSWANQTIIRFGIEYNVYDFMTILAGFRNKTALFVPDGAAITENGPNNTTYTAGLSFDTNYGRFDFAYEMSSMRYFDSYFSNTNYNSVTRSNFLLGYTLTL